MTRTGLLTFFAAWLTAGAAVGQTTLPGQNEPRPGKERRSKIEIELPERDERRAPTPTTPSEYVMGALADLEKYPAAKSMRTIDQLALAGSGVIEPLRSVLAGIRFEPKIGAAVALSQLRDEESFDTIERLLNDPRAKRFAGPILEALERIDPEKVHGVAFGLAGGRDPKLRLDALRFLRSRVDDSSVPALRTLLGSRHTAVRRDAFDLLRKLPEIDVTEDALRMTGDDDAQIAESAAVWLAAHPSEAASDALLELAPREPPDRRSMWALVTLAEIEEQTGGTLLPEEWIERLDPRLDSRDALERVTAAIALAQIGFRSERDDVDTLLGGRVLPALMETWLRNEFFKDFLPLFRMSKSRVQRITGMELGDDLTVWREAWRGGGGVPMIRRDLDPKRLAELTDRLVVEYERRRMFHRGRDRTVVFATPDLIDAPPADFDVTEAFFVPKATMERLVARLLETDILVGRRAAAPDGPLDGFRRLSVAHENRERSVVVGDVDDAAFDEVERLVLETAADQSWQQLFVGPEEGFAAFYHQRAGSFAADVDPAIRDAEYLEMVEVALALLGRAQRIDALAALWGRLRAKRIPFGHDELRLVLHGLRDEQVPEGPLSVVASIVIDRGDKTLFSPFAEFLVERFQLDAVPLLVDVVRELGVVDDALGDPRVPVRLAACEVARETGTASTSALRLRLVDSDPRVVRAAIQAMGNGRSAEQRAELLHLAQGNDDVRRRMALEGLGWEGSDEAFRVLQQAVLSDDAAFVVAAYRGLARIGGEASIRVLDEAVARHGATTQAGLDALDALADIGGSHASEVLAGLLDAERPEIREEAAYRLALLGDMRAVPTLLDVLEVPSRSSRAEDSLALLLFCEGGDRGASFVQRWRDEPTLSSEAWFRRALDLNDDRSTTDLPLAVLLPAVRDPRWYVRVRAVERLESRYGVTFGSPRRIAGEGDIDRLARRWDGYLAVPREVRATKDGG